MGLTNEIAQLFTGCCVTASQKGKALSLGTVDFWVDWKTILKNQITEISERDYLLHSQNKIGAAEWHNSSKELTKLFFRHFGYASYEEIDINERADIRFDLNNPIPEELKGKYDLIWDISAAYVMNVIQAFKNIIDMLRIGGKVVHTARLGDQTNASYWVVSPNLYLDFYRYNGFSIEEVCLFDRDGHRMPYTELLAKGTPVDSLIPLRLLPKYYFRMVRFAAYRRVSSSRLWQIRIARKILNTLLTGKRPSWSICVIATKQKSCDTRALTQPIQNIYR